MELKDVILSTLAEMEDEVPNQTPKQNVISEKKKSPISQVSSKKHIESSESEVIYLHSIRERLLVLFEGFQAPNNTNIEAKVDMTLNFLEYVLATIDTRVQNLEKENK